MFCQKETLMLTAIILSASLLAGEPEPAKHLTMADVAKALSLDEATFRYSDEPPGKLQAVECQATLGDTPVKVRVRIELIYTPSLFSDKREWDIKRVRAATVRKVTIEPAG
jgi:hypothetical protein